MPLHIYPGNPPVNAMVHSHTPPQSPFKTRGLLFPCTHNSIHILQKWKATILQCYTEESEAIEEIIVSNEEQIHTEVLGKMLTGVGRYL